MFFIFTVNSLPNTNIMVNGKLIHKYYRNIRKQRRLKKLLLKKIFEPCFTGIGTLQNIVVLDIFL